MEQLSGNGRIKCPEENEKPSAMGIVRYFTIVRTGKNNVKEELTCTIKINRNNYLIITILVDTAGRPSPLTMTQYTPDDTT